MIPKLNFAYSSIYDKNWSLALDEKFDIEKNKLNYENFIKKFEKIWMPKEKKIFNLFSKYSNLNWTYPKIKIYFVSNLNVSGFSDPLTIKMRNDYPKIAETLIHELLHKIFVQNIVRVKPILNELRMEFPEETKTTQLHLLINFLSNKIFTEVFGKEEAERIKSLVRQYVGLKKAYNLLDNVKINYKIERLIRNLIKI